MSDRGGVRGEVRIREAQTQDVDTMVALERATGAAPHWGRALYRKMLADCDAGLPRVLLVAVGGIDPERGGYGSGEHLMAFVVGAMRSAEEAEVESLAVAVRVRRAGVGSALVRAVAAWCQRQGAREIGLEVRAGNGAAIRLYRRLGFVEVGRRQGYYSDPVEDATIMKLDLMNPPDWEMGGASSEPKADSYGTKRIETTVPGMGRSA